MIRKQSVLLCTAVALGAILAAVLPQAVLTQAQGNPVVTAVPAEGDSSDDKQSSGKAVATFAGGCFWCTEAVFERIEGVDNVVSGYIGGSVDNPNYKQVCSGRTGHAEAVEITYDPAKVEFEELMEIFFATHDPTTLNRQGADSGTQYRSSIFFHNDQQLEEAKKYIEKLNKTKYNSKIVTKLEKATKFYPAELYHQDFFQNNPNYGYCQAVVVPKVRKVNRSFSEKLKDK
ncbi:Peptide methionine sulfoxide reductase MsrA [Stieleria bergensis]|uniref:Peptide methionine sulfoxide reductase MsrA n=1 Tax=Stieleria bergensis TaxID=2528025 RepID=A0A517T160_9BACT|nr:Peptide methionine sulfoxide reductase MsrA [Planctomycetes bacterium SV_7m_r]